MIDEERLNAIWEGIIGYKGTKRVEITKPDVLVDDVCWMIQIIKDQYEELELWRSEGTV